MAIFMSVILTVLLIFVGLTALMFFYALYWGLFFQTPWLPLNQKIVERMLILAEIKPNDILYDLGSGDGRIVVAAAKKYQIKSKGIEISWPLCLWSKLKIKWSGCGRTAKVKCGNFFKEDLSEATIVIFYLTPQTIQQLIPKLKQNLRPGTKIISARFKINEWPALKIDQPTPKDAPLYYYQLQSL